MLSAYTGNPGSGKSHGVVKEIILPALRKGRTIVHNMPLNEAAIMALEGVTGSLVELPADVSFDTIVDTFQRGAILLLDEFWRFFPSGMKSHTIPEKHRGFFALHRHMVGINAAGKDVSTDIVIVCQNLSQVCTFVRDLVDNTYRYVKLTQVGADKRFRCDVYRGPVTGPKPPDSAKLSSSFGEYDPAVYALYRSHTMSESGGAGSEVQTDTRNNMLKSTGLRLKFGALILVPFLIWGAIALTKAMIPEEHKKERAAPERSEGAAVLSSVTKKPAKAPATSHTWRVAGTISRPSTGVMIVLQSLSGVRYLKRSACLDDDSGSPICTIDGEIVATWTGAPESTFLGRAAATPENIIANTP